MIVTNKRENYNYIILYADIGMNYYYPKKMLEMFHDLDRVVKHPKI